MLQKRQSRTKQAVKNIATGFFSQIIIAVVSLFTTRVIKVDLGLQYLGLNGTISNIVGFLALAELGIGSAIGFALYKPLAENDKDKVIALMQFYKKAYRIIAIVILIISLLIVPFLKKIIDTDLPQYYVYLVYFLFVINSVISYLLSYKQNILTSDQKNYIRTFYSTVTTILLKILQLLSILLFDSYIIFLVCMIFTTLGFNIYLSLKVDKLYPYLKTKEKKKIDKEVAKSLSVKIRALFLHTIGKKCVTGTDTIIVSAFIGVIYAGIYTSYYSLVSILISIITTAFSNLSASVGNFVIEKDKTDLFKLFKKFVVIENSISIFVCICFATLITPFVTCWLGEDSVLPYSTVFLFALSVFLQIKRNSISTVIAGSGLYEFNQLAPVFESIINLVVSIVGAIYWGINGVIAGTIISCLLVPFWFNPYYIYKNIFNRNSIIFFLDTIFVLIVIILGTSVVFYLQKFIIISINWGSLIIYFSLSISFSLILVFLVYGKKLIGIFLRKESI